MSIDSIGDFLTIIRNGIRVQKRSVEAPYSKLKHNIIRVLKDEGYIRDYHVVERDGHRHITVVLKYVHGEPVIHEITRISKPGLRYYEGVRKIKPVIGGLGVSIISTNAGVMTDRQAHAQSVGGEIICNVW